MFCNPVSRIGLVVELERAGEFRDATVVGEVSGNAASVRVACWADGSEVDLTDLEETYCEGLLEDAARREAARLAELVPAFRRVA